MSSDVIIRAESLGKKYIIGHQASKERNPTLRDAMVRSATGWARSISDLARGAPNIAGDEIEEFWALKDINFEIRRGETIGIIGRNGAGKSTLLKVLSRITEPTTGRVEIRGRTASLLEVGTGFHPELSGRENIYLNGAVLGMTRAEISRKFDEIVSFAEVERFLDTPVKRYSSGMYVRLAFAVAAHLEPEILIVDEVLAVGDADFQKKCLGKMQDVAGHGRTVLFVSHNLASIRSLCQKGILLQKGSADGVYSIDRTINRYMNSSAVASSGQYTNETGLIKSASIKQFGQQTYELQSGCPTELELIVGSETHEPYSIELCLRESSGIPIAFWPGALLDKRTLIAPALSGGHSLSIDFRQFAAGEYSLDISITIPRSRVVENIEGALKLKITRTLESSGWEFLANRGQGFVLLQANLEKANGKPVE